MVSLSIKQHIEKLQILLSHCDTENNPSLKKEIEDQLLLLKTDSDLIENNPLAHDFDLDKDFNNFHQFINEHTHQAYYYLKNNIIFWKGAAEKLLNISNSKTFSQEDFIGIIHPEDREEYITFHQNFLKNKEQFCLSYRISTPSGEYIFVEDTGQYIENSVGEIVKMGIIADITPKQKVAEIIRQKEKNYNILHDIALVNTRDVSLEEMLVDCIELISRNTEWPIGRSIILYKGRFDSSPNQFVWSESNKESHKEFINILHQEKQQKFSQFHLELIESKKHFKIEDVENIPDVKIRTAALASGLSSIIMFTVPVRQQAAVVVEFFSNQKEKPDFSLISLLKQLSLLMGNMIEKKIIEDEFDRFLLAIEQNFASVVITDSKGYIIYANPRFSEITGYSNQEVLGKKPGLVKSGLHDKQFYTEMWATISKGGRWQGELTNKRKDGTLYCEQVNISPIKDKDNNITHYVGVKIDITEKKKGEEDLKDAKDAAEQANRTKSEFLASMSHEIRTPMNAILGFAELLALKITDEMQSSYLESIRSSGKTLLNLINDVLDLSKIDAGKMKVNTEFFDPFHLFKDVEYMFTLKAQEKGLDFKVEVDMNLPVNIETDEIRLRQILINLIANAVKFTEHGYVKVAATCTHCYYVGNDQFIDMTIDIVDSGIGISEEFQKIMFTPFTQQEGQDNKRYGGTGLGLTITNRLIQLLDAELTVRSKPGLGSIFSIHFSQLRASSKMQKNVGLMTITPDKIKFEPSRIIVADDVANNRNYFKGIVENTNIEIIESDNGLTTIELAKKYMPDAIITDIKMPGIDGFELLKRVREIPEIRHIPVVATTASTSVEDKNKLFKHNFDGILIKPIQVNDVYLELMRLLPHNINDIDKQYNGEEGIIMDEESVSISAINDEQVHTAKRMLETDLYNIWKTFDEQQPLSEVESFARKCRELGQKYELAILISYGNRLLSAINNFDIDNMLKTLKEYPKLLNTFKTIN